MSTRTKGRKCVGKRRYDTMQAAVKIMKRLVANGALREALNAYPCEHCLGFHIGHRGRQSGRRRRT